MTNKLNFTKAGLTALPPAEPGKRAYYNDTRVLGLQVQVTDKGVKTYYVYKRIHGRPKRIKLGRFPDMSPALARDEAQICLAQIAKGDDPMVLKREKRAKSVTLATAFEDFKEARNSLKAKTLYDYQRVMNVAFPDWQKKELILITKDMVARRHQKLGRERGQAYANLALRVFRTVYNFARSRYEDEAGYSLLPENPVQRLTDTRAWYKQRRRDTVITRAELPAWFRAVNTVRAEVQSSYKKGFPNKGSSYKGNYYNNTVPYNYKETVLDYLLVILFTGLRRQEAAQLTWANVDLANRTLKIMDTKNGENHTLPLSDYIYEILSSRHQQADEETVYVFPGEKDNPYLIEPRSVLRKITQVSGITFTIHDLRRTFITVAESLDIPAYALKRLLNHKMTNDVTAGYIVTDVERLRKPMQMITDFLLSVAEIKPSAAVVSLHQDEGKRSTDHGQR
ncbi:MAG: integrase family protein [Candidatus Thiodiazotropha sp. (ex Lucinoma borealis)]|nr:integrase family protein [Candidatus Thiodiazotropha sp. (ex Lucinoma borealis)]